MAIVVLPRGHQRGSLYVEWIVPGTQNNNDVCNALTGLQSSLQSIQSLKLKRHSYANTHILQGREMRRCGHGGHSMNKGLESVLLKRRLWVVEGLLYLLLLHRCHSVPMKSAV